ncbi:unnamed protein product [Blepharisma stoltei]|uniref:Uncharacterized protein n=1 Tax=Blepharisma stoltei TaxID=1481888 RepID=A0AAU9IX80_9CILI|nr:unnamed protein product [Blepharisma stoltei]
MQKNHLLSFYNDSKLNRIPHEKQLQPLFKKKFVFDKSLLQKHLKTNLQESKQEEPIQSISDTSSKPTETVFNIRKNLTAYRKDGSDAPTDGQKEDLETVVNRLKSEKLEVLKDLWTYEDKFDHKYCMRARISEIKQLSTELLKMSESAYERITLEKELFDYLQLGLITLNNEKFEPDESEDENNIEDEEEQENILMDTLDISGSVCIALVKLNEDFSIEITVYPKDFRNAVFLQINSGFKMQSLKIGKKFLLKELRRNLYPKLSLLYREDELSLEFNPNPNNYIKLLFKPKCWRRHRVFLKLSLNGQNIKIETDDPNFYDSLSINVDDEGLKHLFLSKNLYMISSYLHENLTVLRSQEDSKPYLAFKPKPWDIEKFLYHFSHNEDCESPREIKLPDSDKTQFAMFDSLVHKGTVNIEGTVLDIDLEYNMILEKYRIKIVNDKRAFMILEENNLEEFFILKSLQDLDLSYHMKTLFSSLEFQVVITRLLYLKKGRL